MTVRFIDLDAQYRLIADDLERRFRRVHQHGRYVLGPEVEELEERLAELAGARHCVTVSSGTDALLLAYLTLGIGPGDEVVTSPFSFVAAAEMAALLGARVVFADIDPSTYNIDPEAVENVIGPHVKAIVAVSLFGQCADFARLRQIAEHHGIPLIEDAAQSLGAKQSGHHAGGLGLIGCTSFYPSKPLGCYGDGGACFTDDETIAKRLRALRHHGQTGPYRHRWVGINGRLDTLQAAALLAKLPLFETEIQARQRLARRYTEALQGLVTTPHLVPGNTSSFACYTIASPNRDELEARLRHRDIPCAIYYAEPLYRQPALAGHTDPARLCHESERCCREVLSLPIHPYMQDSEQDQVIAAVAENSPGAAASKKA